MVKALEGVNQSTIEDLVYIPSTARFIYLAQKREADPFSYTARWSALGDSFVFGVKNIMPLSLLNLDSSDSFATDLI